MPPHDCTKELPIAPEATTLAPTSKYPHHRPHPHETRELYTTPDSHSPPKSHSMPRSSQSSQVTLQELKAKEAHLQQTTTTAITAARDRNDPLSANLCVAIRHDLVGERLRSLTSVSPPSTSVQSPSLSLAPSLLIVSPPTSCAPTHQLLLTRRVSLAQLRKLHAALRTAPDAQRSTVMSALTPLRTCVCAGRRHIAWCATISTRTRDCACPCSRTSSTRW